LSKLLQQEFSALGMAATTLDGDEVRQRLTKGLGFTKEDRDENVSRIAFVATLLTRAGAVAITAAISPYRAARQQARTEIGAFVEVYVCCPLEICMQRDAKGLYAKALRGEVKSLTGFSDPYEPPQHADIIVNTDQQTPEQSLRTIMQGLIRLGYLPTEPVQSELRPPISEPGLLPQAPVSADMQLLA
jgi:adenylyl-sulfate kinase